MAATTTARDAQGTEGKLKSYAIAASTKILKGTLVGLNSSGYLVAMAHGTASLRFRGVAYDTVDNTSGSNGDKECRVESEGEFEFVYNGGDAAQGICGRSVLALDNQTVDEDTSTATNEYLIGTITEIVSTTKVRVKLGSIAGFAGTQAAIADLTDNGGGTADGTVASQAAPATLTDSTGLSGTHDDVLAATTVPTTLTDSTGLSGTHDDTLAATAAPATLTDNTGLSGTHNDTLEAVTTFAASVGWNGSSVYPSAADEAALADKITKLNQNASDTAQKVIELVTLVGVLAQNDSDTAQKVIELVTLVGVLAQNQSDLGQKVIELVTLAGTARDNLKEVTTDLASLKTALRGAGIIAQ